MKKKMQNGGKVFLQPNSSKLKKGYNIPSKYPSTELATSIGGVNGEPAYLIPSFKQGRLLNDPYKEFNNTGEYLGGPFKTWQEADKWEKEVRHPYVERGQALPSPLKWWGDKYQNGGSLRFFGVYPPWSAHLPQHKFGDFLNDAWSGVKNSGVMLADNATSVINQDIIKDSAYTGRSANDFRNVSHVSGSVINELAPVAAGVFLGPAGSMGMSALQKGAGMFVSPDQSRMQSNSGQFMNKMQPFIGMAGQIGAMGIANNGGGSGQAGDVVPNPFGNYARNGGPLQQFGNGGSTPKYVISQDEKGQTVYRDPRAYGSRHAANPFLREPSIGILSKDPGAYRGPSGSSQIGVIGGNIEGNAGGKLNPYFNSSLGIGPTIRGLQHANGTPGFTGNVNVGVNPSFRLGQQNVSNRYKNTPRYTAELNAQVGLGFDSHMGYTDDSHRNAQGNIDPVAVPGTVNGGFQHMERAQLNRNFDDTQFGYGFAQHQNDYGYKSNIIGLGYGQNNSGDKVRLEGGYDMNNKQPYFNATWGIPFGDSSPTTRSNKRSPVEFANGGFMGHNPMHLTVPFDMTVKRPNGGNIPTRGDSIAVMNSTNKVKAYYEGSGNYQSLPGGGERYFDLWDQNDWKDYINTQMSSYRNTLNKDVMNRRRPTRVPSTNGSRPTIMLPMGMYYKKVDDNRFFQRDELNALVDTRAPMPLYDYRIVPQSMYNGENVNNGDNMYGDMVNYPKYEPLAVTPWDMLSEAQRKERVQKYGTSGTPFANQAQPARQAPPMPKHPVYPDIPMMQPRGVGFTRPDSAIQQPPPVAKQDTAEWYMGPSGEWQRKVPAHLEAGTNWRKANPREYAMGGPLKSDYIDLGLDAASFVPGPVGMVASTIGAAKNLYEGDYVGAGIDALNVVTMGGSKWLGEAARLAQYAGKARVASSAADKAKFLKMLSNPNVSRSAGLVRDYIGSGSNLHNLDIPNNQMSVRDNTRFEMGGELNEYNDMNDLIHYNGPSHEQGGIPVNNMGMPVPRSMASAEVEGGETSLKGYVFSDTLKHPATGKTFADESKAIESRYKNRNDKTALQAKEREMSRLMASNEELRVAKETASYKRKMGGFLKKYGDGSFLGMDGQQWGQFGVQNMGNLIGLAQSLKPIEKARMAQNPYASQVAAPPQMLDPTQALSANTHTYRGLVGGVADSVNGNGNGYLAGRMAASAQKFNADADVYSKYNEMNAGLLEQHKSRLMQLGEGDRQAQWNVDQANFGAKAARFNMLNQSAGAMGLNFQGAMDRNMWQQLINQQNQRPVDYSAPYGTGQASYGGNEYSTRPGFSFGSPLPDQNYITPMYTNPYAGTVPNYMPNFLNTQKAKSPLRKRGGGKI